jgi:hypothetical protein
MAAAVSKTGQQAAVELLREPLAGLGFRKRAGAIFTVELDDPVIGWLGLNAATEHQPAGRASVNPVVGVRHQTVERIVAALLDEQFHPYVGPTVSTPIGYVMPEQSFTTWQFGDKDSQSQADELLTAVENYGLPFMRDHVELESIRDAIEQGNAEFGEYRLPVVLSLLGRDDEAVRMIDDRLQELGDADNPFAHEFRAYAERFTTHANDLMALAG